MSTFINTYSYVIHPNTGLPLVNGSIYFGNVGENPLHQPLPVYLESGQPIPSPCLLYTSPSPRDRTRSRMPSSA